MRTPFAKITRLGLLPVLSLAFYTQALSAKPQAPEDTVTIPDGTPLPLKLRYDFNSATVKLGDSIEFTTPYPLRINGAVVLPPNTTAFGTVTGILPPRRASRDSRVHVTIDKILLPDGRTASLRAQKSANKTPANNAKEVGNHPSMWTDTSVNAGAVVPPTIVVGAFTEKGREWEYRAGSWTTVYFNGPMTIERRALANLEPPPYDGPAQVFINGPKGKLVSFYMYLDGVDNQVLTGEVSLPFRVELKPGRYSISSHRKNGQAVKVEVEANHRYWIGYKHGTLSVEDPEPHKYEMEEFAVAPWVSDKIYTSAFFPTVARAKP